MEHQKNNFEIVHQTVDTASNSATSNIMTLKITTFNSGATIVKR